MIQIYNKATKVNHFTTKVPALVYSCNTHEHQVFPRVMHSHDDLLEIVLFVSGRGKQLIQGVTYPVSQGTLLGYNAGALHDEYNSDGVDVVVYCVGVTNVSLQGMDDNHIVPTDRAPACKVGESYDRLLNVFSLIHALTKDPTDFSGEYCNYLIRALLIMVYECFINSPSTGEPSERVVEGKIKRFLDNHYKEDIRLETVAEALDLSPYHISHVFKDFVGYSPIQYILRRRIGEAQSLLLSTALSVTDIAFRVGFNSSNHFQTMFAKLVGMPPSVYRKYWSNRS